MSGPHLPALGAKGRCLAWHDRCHRKTCSEGWRRQPARVLPSQKQPACECGSQHFEACSEAKAMPESTDFAGSLTALHQLLAMDGCKSEAAAALLRSMQQWLAALLEAAMQLPGKTEACNASMDRSHSLSTAQLAWLCWPSQAHFGKACEGRPHILNPAQQVSKGAALAKCAALQRQHSHPIYKSNPALA
jgi:hypothetical protein